MKQDPLQTALTRLAQSTGSARSIEPAVLSRLSSIQMQNPRIIYIRRFLMRSALGLAACLAVAFAFTMLFTQPQVAFADVVDKVNQTHTLAFDIEHDPNGLSRTLIKAPDWMRMEQTGGRVMIWNKTTGQSVSLDPVKKSAVKMILASQPFDFYSWFKDFKNDKPERVGEKIVDGKRLLGFKVTRAIPDAEPRGLVLVLWVDPATDLPVRAELDAGDRTLSTFTNLRFDVPLDDSLFDTTIPKGYTVQDLGGIPSDQLKPPPTTQQTTDLFTLIPNVGLGHLKFGATKDEIIKTLGPPEQSRDRYSLGYPSKGFFLMISPTRGLVVITIMSKSSFGPFAGNAFPGRTDKGISVDSSTRDLERAYGKPSSAKENYAPGMSMLEYQSLHATFTLSKGKIAEILLQKP